jgi:hypothetical protein
MLDLNRVFPGDPDGAFTHQMAFAIQRVLREECEYLIDFHCGGLFPTVDYVFLQGDDEEFARSIGSRVLYSGSPHKGSVSDCLPYIQRAIAGVSNVLRAIGMLDGEVLVRSDQLVVSELRIVRPHAGGLLISSVGLEALGEVVSGTHELGRILHTQTFQELEVLATPFENSVFILVREGFSPVGSGDIAYILGNASSVP